MSKAHPPTEAQREAITTVGMDLCVDAGAGSGKTRVLVERIVHLLEHGLARLDEIVAITFTDKAALEMKDRLRKASREKAPLDDANKMSFWRDIERRVTHARISTIHSFCAAVLREHALSQDRDPDFVSLAEAEAALLRRDVVQEALEKLLGEGDDAARALAVEYGVGPLSGALDSMLSRRGLVERIAGIQPLGDADELKRWSLELYREVMAERMKVFATSRTLRGLVEALEALEGLCTDSDDLRERLRVQMIDLCGEVQKAETAVEIEECLGELAAFDFSRYRGKKNWPLEDFEALKKAQDRLRGMAKDMLPTSLDEEVELRASVLTTQLFEVYEHVAAAYRASKESAIGMDFEDLILDTLHLLESNEDARLRVAGGIKYLLIDEFQDTDRIQLRIARLLTQEGEDRRAELFVVGDAKQSIYDFRGAEIEVFNEVRESSGKTIHLDENFRSSPNVLEFINHFFDAAGAFEEGGIPYHRLIAHRPALEGARIDILIPETEDASNADALRGREADLIGSRLVEMCSGPGAVEIMDAESREMRTANFGDAAILFRSTSSLYAYEDGLKRYGVPFNVVAGQGYYERQEISDVLNVLRLVVNPLHERALCGFLRSPLVALSDESLLRLCVDAPLGRAFWAGAELEDAEQERRLVYARTLLGELSREAARLRLPTFLRRVLEVTRVKSVLLAQHHGTQKAANLQKLVALADDFSRSSVSTVRNFIRYLGDVSSQSIREGDAPLHGGDSGAVTLMTIHKAKGLEFPIVVLADIARMRPSAPGRSLASLHRRMGLGVRVSDALGGNAKPATLVATEILEQRQDDGERARVLYVAMTRARDWLVLSGAPGEKKASTPTWFDMFDEVFDLRSKGDGDRLRGEGWAATVRRKPGETMDKAAREKSDVPRMNEGLWLRTESLVEPERTGASQSITGLARLLSNDTKEFKATTGNGDALTRGTLVHRVFERWDFEGDVEATVNSLIRLEPLMAESYEALRGEVLQIAERFKKTDLYRRFRAANRIEREAPFTLALGGWYLNGTVDALVDGRLLVDFKTGALDDRRHAGYEWQLRLYALAMEKTLGAPPDEAVIYYADTGEVRSVDVGLEALREAERRAIEVGRGSASGMKV